MQTANILQDAIHILSNPAWGGLGSIAGIMSIPMSIFFAGRSSSPQNTPRTSTSPKKSY